MKVSGIVCEYNPMHNGHLYQIEQTRKNGATHIVGVMSGNFVQRGDLAITDKFSRAETAIKNGIDLVVEIPVSYCLASAEFYAKGAVWLMEKMGCIDEISFGSECGDTGILEECAEQIIECNQQEINELMEKGLSYPVAVCEILERKNPKFKSIISSPNNLLAIEYLKALKKFRSLIKPFTVRRYAVSHDSSETESNFASASAIRQRIAETADYTQFIPQATKAMLENAIEQGTTADIKRLETAILYKMRTLDLGELRATRDVGQGLEYRIMSAIGADSYNELLARIKTKRYPLSRIRRIILQLLIGIKKSDTEELPPYIRVLAFNRKGTEILAKLKKNNAIYGTSLIRLSEISEIAKRFAELEARAGDIYTLAYEKRAEKGFELTRKITLQ